MAESSVATFGKCPIICAHSSTGSLVKRSRQVGDIEVSDDATSISHRLDRLISNAVAVRSTAMG